MSEFITLQLVDNSVTAHILKGKLEAQGVEAFLFQENLSSIYNVFNYSSGGIKLCVAKQDAEKATQILSESHSSSITTEE